MLERSEEMAECEHTSIQTLLHFYQNYAILQRDTRKIAGVLLKYFQEVKMQMVILWKEPEIDKGEGSSDLVAGVQLQGEVQPGGVPKRQLALRADVEQPGCRVVPHRDLSGLILVV